MAEAAMMLQEAVVMQLQTVVMLPRTLTAQKLLTKTIKTIKLKTK
jgi:hypothetical protein